MAQSIRVLSVQFTGGIIARVLGVGDRIFWKSDKGLKIMGNYILRLSVLSRSSAASALILRHCSPTPSRLRPSLRPLSHHSMGVRTEGAHLCPRPQHLVGERCRGEAVTERGTMAQDKEIPAARRKAKLPHYHAPFPVWTLKGSPGRVVLPNGTNLYAGVARHTPCHGFLPGLAHGASFRNARRPGGTWLRDSARREHLCPQLP